MSLSSPTTSQRSEHGFGLVEILVVMVIISILSAVVYLGFRQGKASTHKAEARTVGLAYAQAITQYQANNANHNPAPGAPAGSSTPWGGPLNLLGKPYMKHLPEAVTTRRVLVSGTCEPPGASSPSTQDTGFVSYCPLTEPQYEVRVWTRPTAADPWPAQPTCIGGSTAQTSVPAC